MKNYKNVTGTEYQQMLSETASYRYSLLKKHSYLSEYNRTELKSELEYAVFEGLQAYDEFNLKGASKKTFVTHFIGWKCNDFLCAYAHGGIAVSHDDWAIRTKVFQAREENPHMSETELADMLGISVKVLRTHTLNLDTVYTSKPVKGYEDENITIGDTLCDNADEDTPYCYRYKGTLKDTIYSCLGQRDAEWFILANGLFGHEKKTTEQIGQEYGGVSHQYVSKVNKASFSKIQKRLLDEDSGSQVAKY